MKRLEYLDCEKCKPHKYEFCCHEHFTEYSTRQKLENLGLADSPTLSELSDKVGDIIQDLIAYIGDDDEISSEQDS